MNLDDAIASARAELEQLKARETNALGSSGLPARVRDLTAVNQALSVEREAARERIAGLQRALREAREKHALLELQLKGARSRTQKLRGAL